MEKTKDAKQNAKEKMIDAIVKGINQTQSLPWDCGRLNGNMLPINRVSGNGYHGINRMMLMLFARSLPKADCEFATFRQAQKKGGHVRKGEKGCPVLFFTKWNKTKRCPAETGSDEEGDEIVLISKTSFVFDTSQCEGVEPRREVKSINHPAREEVDRLIQRFATATNLELDIGKKAGSGFYEPATHRVSVAGLEYHKAPEDYYSTIFHELIHSTYKAMGRKTGTSFGSHQYSEEEIVAETGAMLLCLEFGFAKTARDNSIAYLQHWGRKLQENPDWLMKGVRDAEKAAAYFCEQTGYTPQII